MRNLNKPSSGSCSSERFYFAVDGKQDLSTSTYYCGTKTVSPGASNGNQMVLGIFLFIIICCKNENHLHRKRLLS